MKKFTEKQLEIIERIIKSNMETVFEHGYPGEDVLYDYSLPTVIKELAKIK